MGIPPAPRKKNEVKYMLFEDYSTEDNFEVFKGNKYMLVNVAAQRARQINEGTEVYVRSHSRHPLQIALEEVASGYVGFERATGEDHLEVIEPEEEILSFDEMVNIEADFDFEDDEAFDIEPIDFEDEFANEDFDIAEE